MSAVLSILFGGLRFLGGFLGKLLDVITLPPVSTLLIVALSVGLAFEHSQLNDARRDYTELKTKVDAEEAARAKRVSEIEKSSVQTANNVDASIKQTVTSIDALRYGYASMIGKAEKTQTLVKIVTKEIKSEDNVYREGNSVVCRKLPSEFVTNVNNMVKEANK